MNIDKNTNIVRIFSSIFDFPVHAKWLLAFNAADRFLATHVKTRARE